MSENDLLTLARELAEALADHHAGLDTTRPFRETYERDAALLDRARAMLAAEDETDLTAIHASLEAAAQAVATLPPDRWAGWVVYLLEALQEHAPEEDYRGVLLSVAGDIDGWLEMGRW